MLEALADPAPAMVERVAKLVEIAEAERDRLASEGNHGQRRLSEQVALLLESRAPMPAARAAATNGVSPASAPASTMDKSKAAIMAMS